MIIVEIKTLEQRAENFFGRLIPLHEVDIASNESAVFSDIIKDFGPEQDASENKYLNKYSLIAELIGDETGQPFFVPIEVVLDYFERNR